MFGTVIIDAYKKDETKELAGAKPPRVSSLTNKAAYLFLGARRKFRLFHP